MGSRFKQLAKDELKIFLENVLADHVSRSNVEALGLYSKEHMARLDATGKGPSRLPNLKKALYQRHDFIEWLVARWYD